MALAALLLFATAASRAEESVVAKPELRGVAADSSGEKFNLSTPGAAHSDWLSLGESFEGWSLVSFLAPAGPLVLRDASGAELRLSLASSHVLTLDDLVASSTSKGSCVVSVKPGGTVTWDGTPVEDGQLQSALIKLHGKDPNFPITIQMDDKADLKKLAFVILDAPRVHVGFVQS